MDEVDLGIPKGILDSLPEDGANAGKDMERALEDYERRVNAAIRTAESDAEAASQVLNVIDHLESRARTYDEFVPELRAWGQSPIYAIAWRNFCVSLIDQFYEHEELAARLDRERNARIVDDGIRLSDAYKD
ncbi:hypothetical protein [Halorarius litoreus]|uniref:hypothetical protein n=1 Tax=Halorarius litoreus TaxID=2962676 RepID=UPI0020CCAA4E|nr:hypothetical protein [Halorarius litoreus]